jgi:hypothetical protein
LRIAREEVVSDSEINLQLSIEGPPQAGESSTPAQPILLGAKARKIGNEWKLEPGAF